MKLWYQSTVRQTQWGARSRAMREILDAVKAPDTEIELHGTLREALGSGRLGPPEPLDVEEIVRIARLAADRGFDAFLIGNIADPGLDRTREIIDIPVLGLCEASLKAAGMMGASFALVTANHSFTSLVVDNIARYGMRDRVTGIQDMGIEQLRDIDRGFDDAEVRRRLIRRFHSAARTNGGPGSDVVIAAGGMVMALLAYGKVEETEDGTPVVDGIANLVKLGELTVKVNRVIGGKFAADRLDLAAEMLRSFDAAPLRRTRPASFVTLENDGAISGIRAGRSNG